MKWIEALKKWNEGKQTWCIPRKGSDSYKEVRAIMDEKPVEAVKEVKKEEVPIVKLSDAHKKGLDDAYLKLTTYYKELFDKKELTRLDRNDIYSKVEYLAKAKYPKVIPVYAIKMYDSHIKRKDKKVVAAKPVKEVKKKGPKIAPKITKEKEVPKVPANLDTQKIIRNILYYYSDLYKQKKLTTKDREDIARSVIDIVKYKFYDKIDKIPEYAEDITRNFIKKAIKKYPSGDWNDALQDLDKRQYTDLIYSLSDSDEFDSYLKYIDKNKLDDDLTSLKKWAKKNDYDLY